MTQLADGGEVWGYFWLVQMLFFPVVVNNHGY